LILIPIAWLAALSLLVAICRVAAEGDATLVGPRQSREELIGVRVTLAPSAPHSSGHRRLRGRRTLSRPGLAVGRQRIAVRSLHRH